MSRRPNERMTPREEAFVRAYLRGDRSNADAMVLAGFRGSRHELTKRARKLLDRPRVRAHLDAVRAAATSSTVASLRERLERLSHIGRGHPVEHVLKDGTTVEAAAGPRDQIAAIAEIGKLQGDYTKRTEVDTTHRTLVDFIDALDGAPAPAASDAG